MKKIHCFTESQAGGGAEHQMNILAGLLAENGYDVTLVTYADVPDHYAIPKNVKRVELGHGHNPLITFLRIFWYFLWVKTDCVISYRVACNARVLIPLLFRPWTKVIACERSFTIGKSSLYGKIACNVLYYRANHIVTNCFSQQKYLTELGKRWKNKVLTIINYTELDKCNISSSYRDDNMIKVGVFANLSPWKNLDGLACAIKELKKKNYRNLEIHWYGNQKVALGSFSQDYLNAIESIKQKDVQDIFKLHPATKDVLGIMSEMTAICLPSLYEGFSNTISEGICCGKPMLVSDVSDNSLMVHEGENGFLFDPNDINSIVEAFEKFLALEKDQMEEMGKKSRVIAEQLFDKDSFIKSYMSLIE
ncbi:MAG: glycosyltransferase [Bacteroidia bacterium]|nr:glycosyltransferase [Bacteroidia bacterium]